MNQWKYTHAKNTTCEQFLGSESPEFDPDAPVECERDASVTASTPSGLKSDYCQLHATDRLLGLPSEFKVQWIPLPDCPLGTQNYGAYGYIYRDRSIWIAVAICDSGDELDMPCPTLAEAKSAVEREAWAND
jgi:hypothetical protein